MSPSSSINADALPAAELSSPLASQQTSHQANQQTQERKADHLRICLDEDVQSHRITNGFEHYRFTHCCLPELNRNDIELRSTFLGKAIATPLLISSMTGGTEQAQLINQRLAKTAQRFGLAMGVGSQRVAVENPALTKTFSVRQYAPDALLFANLGAVQLNYDYGIEQCQKAVDALEADALILHLNPLQEAVQTEGDVNFKGLFAKVEQLAKVLPVPVVAKEVGNGISAVMARRLVDAGVAAIDVAGAGGTSWARVESERAKDARQRRLGNTFADWGIPTAECLTSIRSEFRTAPAVESGSRISSTSPSSASVSLIASGGLRNGLDAAKAIALGADLVGMAMPFLQAASQSEEALAELSEALIAELTTVLFCTGSESLLKLRQPGVIKRVVKYG